MERWNLTAPAAKPHCPEILYSGKDGRAIVLDLPAGEELQDHQVHEAAWVTVVTGDVTVTDREGVAAEVGPGVLVHIPAAERSEVRARSDARLLLLLTPWPGDGHPGAMSLQEKSEARSRAAERAP